MSKNSFFLKRELILLSFVQAFSSTLLLNFFKGWVYGSNGGHYLNQWYNPGEKIIIKGNPKKKWAWIHVDDLADAFVRAIEAPISVVKGQIFHVGDDSSYTFEEIVTTLAKAAGSNAPVVYEEIGNDGFAQFVEVNCLLNCDKIREKLGWKPRKAPFLKDLDLYYAAFKAASH
jgi:nucleoside-diphosphate-sugar epimerase